MPTYRKQSDKTNQKSDRITDKHIDDKHKTYRMISFEDGINADRQAMDYRRKEREVSSSDKLDITLVRNGGWAAVLE